MGLLRVASIIGTDVVINLLGICTNDKSIFQVSMSPVYGGDSSASYMVVCEVSRIEEKPGSIYRLSRARWFPCDSKSKGSFKS